RVRELIERVSGAVTWVLGFSLAAGILVLLAALAATADERRFESALLRTLGASRGKIRTAVLAEFAALGVLCGVIGALGAAATGWALARHVFKLGGYLPPLLPLLVATLAATLLVTLAGGLGTLRMSRTPPMAVLRRGQ
ncbi:MAG: FtsX-like permease family protein, partial [Dokdonella sp.]